MITCLSARIWSKSMRIRKRRYPHWKTTYAWHCNASPICSKRWRMSTTMMGQLIGNLNLYFIFISMFCIFKVISQEFWRNCLPRGSFLSPNMNLSFSNLTLSSKCPLQWLKWYVWRFAIRIICNNGSSELTPQRQHKWYRQIWWWWTFKVNCLVCVISVCVFVYKITISIWSQIHELI